MPVSSTLGGSPATVLLVGAGGIGSRHLQALARLERPLQVTAVDTSFQSLRLAQERVRQIRADSDGKFRFTTTLDDAPSRADIAIVATGAGVRRRVVDQILERGEVRHLLLEKFLFQRLEDYDAVGRHLAEVGTAAWVNTPRRLWPGYMMLASCFGGEPVTCRVQAPATVGIGTSAIHFADLLAYLSRDSALELVGEGLERTASRHVGAFELTGTVRGGTPGGSFLEYRADARTSAPLLVSLSWPRARSVIREAEQRMWLSTEDNGWSWSEEDFPTRLQSEMTDGVVADLLDTGSCGLPSYAESSVLHTAVLRSVAETLAGPFGPSTVIPIT